MHLSELKAMHVSALLEMAISLDIDMQLACANKN
jgi:hypothetical protein